MRSFFAFFNPPHPLYTNSSSFAIIAVLRCFFHRQDGDWGWYSNWTWFESVSKVSKKPAHFLPLITFSSTNTVFGCKWRKEKKKKLRIRLRSGWMSNALFSSLLQPTKQRKYKPFPTLPAKTHPSNNNNNNFYWTKWSNYLFH